MKKRDVIVPEKAKIEISFIEDGYTKKKVIRTTSRIKKYILEKIISQRHVLVSYQIEMIQNEKV